MRPLRHAPFGPRYRWSVLPGLAFWMAALGGSSTAAQTAPGKDVREGRAHLQWQRPPQSPCISREQLEQDVEQLLDRDVLGPRESAAKEIRGYIARRGAGWAASFSLIGPGEIPLGTRELETQAADCAALDASLAVVLATLLDEPAAHGGGPSRALPAFGTWGVGASAAFGAGFLPSPAWGASLLGQWVLPGGGLELIVNASAWLPRQWLDPTAHGARLQAVQAGLGLCPRLLQRPPLVFSACASTQIGAQRARGVGLDNPRSEVRLLALIGVEIALSIQILRHGSLRLSAAPVWALSRPRFYYQTADNQPHELFRSELFAGLFQLGVIADGL